MSKIFISYRRDDSAGYAHAIYRELLRYFSKDQLFMDVDTVKPGVDFVRVIEEAVGECDVLVALIGKRWVGGEPGGTSRLDNEKDYVRLEVSTALARDVHVIPVLVDGMTMPSEDILPAPLQPLTRRNALDISNTRFNFDVERVITAVRKILDATKARGKADKAVPRRWRTYRPVAAAVAVVLILFSFVIWWSKRQETVGRLSSDERRELRSASAQRLAALIRSTSTSGGGFRVDLDKPDSEPDTWTSAQCISGLASAGLANSHEIRHALAFISRSYGSEVRSVELTSWVGLAFLSALQQDQLWVSLAERENGIREVQRAHRYLSERQSRQGGWSSYETYYAGPGAFAHYATFIAMKFLIALRETKMYAGDISVLDDQIRRGLAWILGRYDTEVKGWNEYASAVRAQKDLATLYLLVLTEASRSGFSFVTSHPNFVEALGQWISSSLNDSIRRKVAENTDLRQEQEIFDASGKRVDSKSRAISILWHPWSLLLASYLSADDRIPPSQTNEALDLRDRLFRRLPETVTTFNRGFTFAAAETLFALSSAK